MDGVIVNCIYRIYILILCGVICDRRLFRDVCDMDLCRVVFNSICVFVCDFCLSHWGVVCLWGKYTGFGVLLLFIKLRAFELHLLKESALFFVFINEQVYLIGKCSYCVIVVVGWWCWGW